MKKVMFKIEGIESEPQEYEDTATEEEIEEDFREWLAGRSEWWIEE